MENKFDDRFTGRDRREKSGNIGRRTVNVSIPCLRCKPDLSEMQAWVVAGLVTCIVIPFHIDLRNVKGVTGPVVYSHLHDVVVQPERSMGYAGYTVTANGGRCDGWN